MADGEFEIGYKTASGNQAFNNHVNIRTTKNKSLKVTKPQAVIWPLTIALSVPVIVNVISYKTASGNLAFNHDAKIQALWERNQVTKPQAVI